MWRLTALVAIAGIGLALFARLEPVGGENHIARLDVRGVIVEDAARAEAIDEVARNDNAKALIVHINSPGGTVVGGESLFHQFRMVAERKPVVAVIGTLGASGGYMAAIGADRIVARAGSLTGSIGVVLQTTDVTGLLDKIGVKAEAIKSDPLKGVPSPLEPLSDRGRSAMETIVAESHQMFLDMVAQRRNLSPERARELGNGRIYTGRQAVDNGLVDAIGGEPEAREWLASNRDVATDLPVRDIRINRGPKNLFGLVEQVFGKPLFSERLTLDGLISLWQPE